MVAKMMDLEETSQLKQMSSFYITVTSWTDLEKVRRTMEDGHRGTEGVMSWFSARSSVSDVQLLLRYILCFTFFCSKQAFSASAVKI